MLLRIINDMINDMIMPAAVSSGLMISSSIGIVHAGHNGTGLFIVNIVNSVLVYKVFLV